MACRRDALAVALAGLLGCGGGAAQPPPAGTRSFVVDVAFNWGGSADDFAGNRQLLLPRQRLTFTLETRIAGKPQLIVGGRGVTATVPVAVAGGRVSYNNLDPSLLDQQRTTFKVGVPPAGTECNSLLSLSFLTLEFQMTGTTLSGLATGFVQYQDGDSIGTVPFDAGLGGAADTVGPALVAPLPAELAVHPFDGLAFAFDEALPANATARLDDGAIGYPLAGHPEGYPSLFAGDGTLLPFGRRLQLAFDSLRDLAGNAGAPPATQVVTPVLPGPFAGFDGPAGLLTGTTRIVDQTIIPALAGKRALLMKSTDGGGRFTARLAVPAGASALVIQARTLGSPSGALPWVVARIGGVGGPISDLPTSLAWTAQPTADSGLPAFPLISPSVSFRNPLPAGLTGEAIVDFSSAAGGCGLSLPPGALLIENLSIE